MSSRSDQDLIISYLESSDGDALAELVQRHLKSVYSFASIFAKDTAIAEDITQEVFIKVWKNLKKFDQKQKFQTWLLTITKNTALDYLRKKKAKVFSSFEDEVGQNPLVDSLVSLEPLPEEIFEAQERSEELVQVIKTLEDKYRVLFLLRLANDLSLAEVAQVLGEPLETVKTRYRRGLIKLKEKLIHEP